MSTELVPLVDGEVSDLDTGDLTIDTLRTYARVRAKRDLAVSDYQARINQLLQEDEQLALLAAERRAAEAILEEIEEHLTASIRAKRVRADGTTVYHYPQSSKPDHLHHAKLFCEAALSILPEDPGRARKHKEEKPSFDRASGHMIPGSLRGQL